MKKRNTTWCERNDNTDENGDWCKVQRGESIIANGVQLSQKPQKFRHTVQKDASHSLNSFTTTIYR